MKKRGAGDLRQVPFGLSVSCLAPIDHDSKRSICRYLIEHRHVAGIQSRFECWVLRRRVSAIAIYERDAIPD